MSEALTTVLPGGASVVDEARDESDALLQRIPELDERDAVARTLASVADAVDLDLIVEPKRRAFLAAFAVGGNIAQACVAAKCARASVRGWREHDEAFDRCFFAAKECAADLLEAEARRAHGRPSLPLRRRTREGRDACQPPHARNCSSKALRTIRRGAVAMARCAAAKARAAARP